MLSKFRRYIFTRNLHTIFYIVSIKINFELNDTVVQYYLFMLLHYLKTIPLTRTYFTFGFQKKSVPTRNALLKLYQYS